MKIVFLHLSDIHIRSEKDISDLHLKKIVESLNCYKDTFQSVIIILSGDLTSSGEKMQFTNVFKIIGTLIKSINRTFNCKCFVIPVPGNHDVNHNDKPLSIKILKDNKYSSVESIEHSKLNSFYNFSKFNECFINKEIYCYKKIVEINGFNIQFNLINNAIYSTRDEYKGLLYIPDDKIDELAPLPNIDFIATVMHHSPDFYRDNIKNSLEEKVISKSSILFFGHEHHNNYKLTSFNGSNLVIHQSGGCLCNEGDWSESSYWVGILNTETKEYNYQKFIWNNLQGRKQYEHDEMIKHPMTINCNSLSITDDFKSYLYDEDYKKGYYVFPTVLLQAKDPEETKQFETFETFIKELLIYNKIIIKGNSNVGKTTLLKKIFEETSKNYKILFCSPDILLTKSSNKKRDINKLVEELFKDIYGYDKSNWQAFEQCNKNDCIFIFDDFDQTEGIDVNAFMNDLSKRFGKIIFSSSQTIDFDLSNIFVNNDEKIVNFEIQPMLGNKRRQLIEAVVRKKADDKSDASISNIANQINQLIKSQISIIPPEPYYLILVAENYINSVGDAVNSNTSVFSKVFEANITNKIDTAIKSKKVNITVELMYILLGKIAYYIHFNKAYPISRETINNIIKDYCYEYGKKLVTEDVIGIAKLSKILVVSENNSEMFRFCNKSQLAYFVAKEIISKYKDTKNASDIEDITNKCCINICTDILLFIIFQTDDTSILKSIITFIENTVTNDNNWSEFDIHKNSPAYLSNCMISIDNEKPVNVNNEKKQLEKTEKEVEEVMVKEFNIKDLYDWDDEIIEKFSNKLIRMTSLLQIISKALPCFEHKLKKDEKKLLIKHLYRLPNIIFMYWANYIDEKYEEIISELKLLPYLYSTNPKNLDEKQKNNKAQDFLYRYSINMLLNLYYIPVTNAMGKNTYEYLTEVDFFDFSDKQTYILQHLMILEQIPYGDAFVNRAIELKDEFKHHIPSLMLRWIVRHGIITRNDKREIIDKLQQKFFAPQAKPRLLIEKMKNKDKKE